MMLAGKTDSATDGGTHSINLCRECAAPGTAIRFKLTLDQSVLKGRITKESLLEAIQQFDAYYEQTYSTHFTPPRGAVNLPQQPHLILGGGSGFLPSRWRTLIWAKKKGCAGRQSKWHRCSASTGMSAISKKASPRTP